MTIDMKHLWREPDWTTEEQLLVDQAVNKYGWTESQIHSVTVDERIVWGYNWRKIKLGKA